MTIEPNMTKEEALRLLCRLHTKFKNLDYDRALEKHDNVVVSRHEIDELVSGLEKLKTRLEFAL